MTLWVVFLIWLMIAAQAAAYPRPPPCLGSEATNCPMGWDREELGLVWAATRDKT